MICLSLLRHPQPLLPGTLCQGHRLLGPTPLTPTSNNNKFPCLLVNYERLFKGVALGCSEEEKKAWTLG